MRPRGYRVAILDGPAVGWGYVLSVPPEPEIAVAPMPEGASHVHGKWMRVYPGDTWPDQRTYRLDEAMPEQITGDGDLLCPYKVVE